MDGVYFTIGKMETQRQEEPFLPAVILLLGIGYGSLDSGK